MVAVCAEEYMITVGSTGYHTDLPPDRQVALNGSQREITGAGDFAHLHLASCIHKRASKTPARTAGNGRSKAAAWMIRFNLTA